jgi:outer membrane protein
MLRYSYLLIATIGLLCGFDARHIAGAEQQLSLRDAISSALENNDELRAVQQSVAAQRQDVGIARSFLLPRVAFEERFLRTDNPAMVFSTKINQGRFTPQDLAGAPETFNAPDPISDFQTSLAVEQPVFARKAHVGLDMAKTELSAKNEEFLRKREELVFKVVQTYLLVHTSTQFATTAEQAVDDSREHLRIAELRYKSNLGLYSDTLRASTAAKEAEQRLVSARKKMQVAKRALGLLLGTQESVGVEPDTPEIPLKELDYYTDASLARKDLKSLRLRYENAKNNIALAEAEYFPVVGLGSSYQMNDSGLPFGAEGDSWQLVAFLRWNLFDGTRREHERAKAKHQLAQTQQSLQGLQKAVAYYVYEAHLGVEEARQNAELAQSARETAEEGKKLVKVRYENSLSPLVDLLDAQLSLNQARDNLVASANEYRIAVANLGYQSGTLLRELNIE